MGWVHVLESLQQSRICKIGKEVTGWAAVHSDEKAQYYTFALGEVVCLASQIWTLGPHLGVVFAHE